MLGPLKSTAVAVQKVGRDGAVKTITTDNSLLQVAGVAGSDIIMWHIRYVTAFVSFHVSCSYVEL